MSQSNLSQLQQGQFVQQSHQQQNQQSSQFIQTTKAGRKNICDTCVKSMSKYTCPACQMKSCSLACINKHKIDYDCNGKADLVAYVDKRSIDEDVVRKDFGFVKNMLEQTDKVKKTLTGVTMQIQQPKRFYFLRKHARIEYNIKVHQAPAMIQRHRQNISFYYMKTQTIYWIVQILYYKGNKKYTRHLLQPQPDSKTISQILPTDFLCQQLLLQQINTQKPQQFDVFIQNRDLSSSFHNASSNNNNSAKKQQNQSETKQRQKSKLQQKEQQSKQKQQKLQKSQKLQKITKPQNRIFQLQKQQKFCQALRNLNIYEFPTLILVHKKLRRSFCKWKKIN